MNHDTVTGSMLTLTSFLSWSSLVVLCSAGGALDVMELIGGAEKLAAIQ
jgi:hypothetical protein